MTSRIRSLSGFARKTMLGVMLAAAGMGTAAAAEPSAAAIDAVIPKYPQAGFSIAISHGDRVVFAKGYGVRDEGTPDKFIPGDQNYYDTAWQRPAAARAAADSRTIYAIGSVTKQFTAAAILLLSEEHRLGLDDAVSRYAPEFTDPNLTLRMLLNQRSGLADLNTLTFLQRVRPQARRPDGSYDSARIDREIAALPRAFAPGARFEYSNSNYYVLGSIVERVTHQTLGHFLAKNVFEPLGMTRTAFATYAAADDVAAGYRVDDKKVVHRAFPWDLAWLGGAGGMTSTVEDLGRWNVGLFAHRMLQPASLAEMWHGLRGGTGQGSYAMGWIEDALGSHRYLWHNGEVGGFHALNVIFPGNDLAFAVLTNNQDAKPEYLVPAIASLYFPVSGLDRILPRSGIVLLEASLAIGIGAMAIAIVAIVTLRRFVLPAIAGALFALAAGFFLPPIVGFVWAGAAALAPTAAYLLAVRFIPKRPLVSKKTVRRARF
jgi:CubicO group peptidase (beta-lactamase class C family)